MSCLDCALGSKNLNLRLFPQTFPTNQRDLLTLLVVGEPRRDNDKAGCGYTNAVAGNS